MRRRAGAIAIAVLGALAPAAGAATGVRVTVNDRAQRVFSGEELSANADLAPMRVTVRRAGEKDGQADSGEVSVAELARLATGLPPDRISRLIVTNRDGNDVELKTRDIAEGFLNDPLGQPRYATLHIDSGRIDFFRPVRDKDDINFPDLISTSTNTNLEVALTTDNTEVREVTARAADTTPGPNEATDFTARLENAPSGVSFTYDWDFGDGSHSQGVAPAHAFAAGHYKVRVSVVGTDGSAGVSDPLDIQVGTPAEATPGPTPTPGAESDQPGDQGHGPANPGADDSPNPGGGEGDPQKAANGTKKPPRRKPGKPTPRATATPTAAPSAAPTVSASPTATAGPARTPGPAGSSAPRRRKPAPGPAPNAPASTVDGILLASAGDPTNINEIIRQANAAPTTDVPVARRGGGGGSVLGWVGGGALLVVLLAGGAAVELRGLR